MAELARTAHNKKKFLEALGQCLGIVSDASINTGVGRRTHYTWLKEDPEYRAAVEDITERTIDHVEGKLYQLINKGDVASTLFFLKTKAKHRGYIERTQTEAITPNYPDWMSEGDKEKIQ